MSKPIQFLIIYIIVGGLFFQSSCSNKQPAVSEVEDQDEVGFVVESPMVDIDLEDVLQRDTLRAITVYGPTSYFLYRGETLGCEYEMARWLADFLRVNLRMVIAEDLDSMITLLNQGHGDLIAYNLTVTQKRQQQVNFTDYLHTTHQVLVQKKPENWRQLKSHQIEQQLIRNTVDLIGQEVHVRENSSYNKRLLNLEKEIGGDIDIRYASGEVITDDLIAMVSNGTIPLTVANDYIAEINSSYLPDIDIQMPVSFDQRLAWAVRMNAPNLLDTLNSFVRRHKRSERWNVIYNKYFKNRKGFRARIECEFYSRAGGKISEYDDLIQVWAEKIGWDWRLLASLIYQESEFKPNTTSWMGAEGLMQVMPRTAKSYGVTALKVPEENMKAGTSHIQLLEDFWAERGPDSTQQVHFILASYNAGQYHVEDARRLAEKFGYDPNIWYGHVEKMMLKKMDRKYYEDPVVRFGYARGTEPVNYVKDILARYEYFKKFIEEPKRGSVGIRTTSNPSNPSKKTEQFRSSFGTP